MKKLNKLFVGVLFGISLLFINGCDPFDDLYVNLAMDIEFSTAGAGQNIFISSDLCLSDFDDYEDNVDQLEEIRYVSSAYFTIDATSGLRAQTLTITLYQEDGNTKLFDYTIPNFVAATYKNNPLEITLTQQQIDDINSYLTNPQEDKCFVATLEASNVQSDSTPYQLSSKVDILTELKVKP
jgi:hypothetical protein